MPERDNPPHTQRIKIVERASLQMAESVMRNYSNSQQAILDLVDNAVDNRIEGQPLVIMIRNDKNRFYIMNRGGEGLDLEGLQNYLQWGQSKKTDKAIGQYGVGGKAAAGFLGNSLEVRCSPKGSLEEYRIFDPNWKEKQAGVEKEHDCEIGNTDSMEGYFSVRVTNLTRGNKIDVKELIAKLGDTYKPLLESGAIMINVNGVTVNPLEIKYLRTDPNFEPERIITQTAFGDKLDITAGVLEIGASGRIHPGTRCYYRGRLIEDMQFFGHLGPAQFPPASRFIAEVSLNNVEVTTNKSSFIKEGDRWEETQKALKEALDSWMEKLAKLKIERKNELEPYEQQLTKEAKRILEHIASQTGILTRDMLPGQAHFRLPPVKMTQDIIKPPAGTKRKPGEIKGATPPNIRADVGPSVKRWGTLFDWDIVPMGQEDIRAQVVVTEGNREQLKINSDYPLYQACKAVSRSALLLYDIETAVAEIGKKICVGQSIEEYSNWVNNILRHIGEHCRNT